MNPNMSANYYAIFALLLYTILNIMIYKFFSHVDPLISLSIYCTIILTMTTIGIVVKSSNGTPLVGPTGKELLIICFCGISCFFADISYFTAYNKGGSLAAITTIVAIMPVFATIIKMVIDRKLPGLAQFSGCVLAGLAVYLVTRE